MNDQILTFDQYGHLTPYEPISTDLPTFERVFVHEFWESTTRRILFDQYQEYNARLTEFLPGYTQWVDGSFVRRKLNPNDIDVLTFVDNALYEQYEQAISGLKQWRFQQPRLIDGFFVRVYPQDHRLLSHSESDRVQWLYDWSRTNTYPRRQKGLIVLTF